ncbi:MAG: VWA domain-containing protein, partial [Pseudomonadota bacterium]
MKLSRMRSVFLILLGLCLAVLFQNCADQNLKLSKSVASVSPKVSFCTSPSDSIRSNLKFIFLVDRSGSNQTNFRILPDNSLDGPYPGTDPLGIRRFRALQDFVQNFQGGEDQYIYWSMVGFSTTATRDQPFTNNRAAFLTFLQDQEVNSPTYDGGFTNYTDALSEGLDMIMEDVADQQNANPQISSNYVIFFVSDGVPRVDTVTQTQTEVNAVIQSYFSYQDANRDLVEGVQINTAYYFEDFDDPNAQAMLSGMSIEGRGEFLQFGAGETIDFTRFAIPLRISRFELKEFWIQNSNTVWEGPELREDADADTLSDSLERALGSNPNLYDTDGNGVGDGVEYRSSGQTSPCQNADCSYVGTPYSTCAQFVRSPNPPFFED